MSWLSHDSSPYSNGVPPIRLMHYDPRWRQEFEQMRSSILHSCEGLVAQVEHIGSTAISGLIAQPIIDAIIVTDRGDTETTTRAAMLIEGLNFRETEPPAWHAGKQVVWLDKPRHGETTHRVLLVPPCHPLIARTISIRNQLQSDREQALEFEDQKLSRWKECEGDAESYEKAKSLIFSKYLKEEF